MNDKTLGAYARHEKPSPSEFARAEFARSASGRAAVRMGGTDSAYAWKVVDMPDDEGWLSNDDMADLGWSPILQCPNPEQHATGRRLTPDAITDEMVERFRAAWEDRVWDEVAPHANFVRPVLAAALIEPPARPEGAERWEDFLIDSLDYQSLTDQQIADLADRIAEEMNR